MNNACCSLVINMPGWTGLADAMVTIFGDCYLLPPSMQVGWRVGTGHGGCSTGFLCGPWSQRPFQNLVRATLDCSLGYGQGYFQAGVHPDPSQMLYDLPSNI